MRVRTRDVRKYRGLPSHVLAAGLRVVLATIALAGSAAAELGLGQGHFVQALPIPVAGGLGFGIVQEIPAGLTDVIAAIQKTPDSPEPYRALLRQVEQELKRVPTDPVLLFKQGLLQYLYGDYEAARTSLEQLVPRTSNVAIREETAFHLGLIAYQQRRYEDSAFFFKDCLWYNPHRANAHTNLGIVLLELGKTAEASAQFQKAVEIDGTSSVALFYLGYLAEQQGDVERSRYYLIMQGKMLDPTSPVFSEWSKKFEEEDVELIQLKRRQREAPQDGVLALQLSRAYLRAGNWTEARRLAEASLNLLPRSWETHAQMGAVLFYEKRYEQALELVERAIELNSENLDLYVSRGSLWIFLKDYDKAEQQLLRVIDANGNHLLAHAVLGQVYCFKHDLPRAEAEYQTCLKIGQPHIEVDELAMRINRLKHGYPNTW